MAAMAAMAAKHRPVIATPGKDSATIGKFVEQIVDYNGSAKSITEMVMDMSPAFRKGATEHLTQAEKVFDRFHVMMLAGEEFDKGRKEVSRESPVALVEPVCGRCEKMQKDFQKRCERYANALLKNIASWDER